MASPELISSYCERRGPGPFDTAVVFCAALTFRTIDLIACPYIPCGTHFLWHLLNGLVVALAMRVMIVTRQRNRAETI